MEILRRGLAICLAFLVVGIVGAQFSVQIPAKPRSGYVLDKAGLLDDQTIAQINTLSGGAQREAHAPIVVVTIPSLSSVGASSVEFYATTLFNAWAIGDRKVNRGVLVLVAQADRKARIEMGAGWGYEREQECQRIMDDWMVPEFKKGNFPAGLLKGVQALDALVRTGKAPRPPWPPWVIPVIIAVAIFAILLAVDLSRHGMDGWGGKFLRFIGDMISAFFNSSNRVYRGSYGGGDSFWGSGGGGWGGGGGFSGGGSSGGGGASGSW